MTLARRFLGVEEGQLRFASHLADSVAFGDARYADLRTLIHDHCARNAIEAPELADPAPFDATAPARLPLNGFGAILYPLGCASQRPFGLCSPAWASGPAALMRSLA